MAVKIRLRRMGANKKPFFRIVAADARSANAGSFLEELGWYDPGKKTDNFKLDLAKAEQWIAKGAQPSDTVKALLRQSRIAAAKAPAVEAPAPVAEPEAAAPTAVPEAAAPEAAPAAEAPAAE